MDYCKGCGQGHNLYRLDSIGPERGGPWWRCLCCGSDSSEGMAPQLQWVDGQPKHSDGLVCIADYKQHVEVAVDWLGHHRSTCPDNTFLEVGHLREMSLAMAMDRSWSVHGFYMRQLYLGTHTTVSPYFHRNLFPRQYSAVLCWELLESVDGWRQLVAELAAVTVRQGLLQIQTVRPWFPTHTLTPNIYNDLHLQVISPPLLLRSCEQVGMKVIEERYWDGGWTVLMRKVDGL